MPAAPRFVGLTSGPGPDIRARRAYYYTGVVGDERKLRKARLAIRELGFEPNVFKKPKGTKSKGVDVSLTTAVVSHAYRRGYDVAFLIAGDGDYVPMVEEAKRAGTRVVVAFFEKHGLILNFALRRITSPISASFQEPLGQRAVTSRP
jgi:uncharacterized LabA/DUF88 family protein